MSASANSGHRPCSPLEQTELQSDAVTLAILFNIGLDLVGLSLKFVTECL